MPIGRPPRGAGAALETSAALTRTVLLEVAADFEQRTGSNNKERYAGDVETLTELITVKEPGASTQNQALSALLFLYGDVLGQRLVISLSSWG